MTTIIGALFQMFLSLAAMTPGRVLAALSIGWLTFTALTALVNTVVTNTMAQWSAMPAAIYQLASLAGFTDAVGIITGAMVARVALVSVPVLGKIS